MFWRMTGFSSASPVETVLDKENYTLEELLDEDEIIQECKAINSRLINYLRDKARVEQLLHYIVEEPPEKADKKRIFKFPFIASEIFTCEVDVILKTLVEDEELMDLLFSFLKPGHPHSTSLAGYFSKVVMCLYIRKTAALMNYVQGHQEIFHQLVDLIGITSIMEVLIRLIGADENMYSNYVDTTQWLKDTDLLEMIVDKFSSSDSPEVHVNAAEIFCAIIRSAPPGFAAKICSPRFIGRLFHHALEGSRPKSVLVNSLSVCISLLDPKRLVSASYNIFRSQLTQGSLVAANSETVYAMLENLGDLLKLLDVSSTENIFPTTYGNLKPPFGRHRLKIVEFVSVLLTIGSEAAERELVQKGAIEHVLDLFFEYPFNNFMHHHVESIIGSCLESKNSMLIEHILKDCDIVGKILEAEKHSLLLTDCSKPTTAAQGRTPPRIGNLGHVMRIANRLAQLSSNSNKILTHLQENSEWVAWRANVLAKRNTVESVHNWACGRPTALQDRLRDSDDEEFRNKDYDVAALANNLNEPFQYGIYNNIDTEEANASQKQENEDVYFDDASAEVVAPSLRTGDDQDSTSLFTNSDWFAYKEDRTSNHDSADSLASPSATASVEQSSEVIAGEEGLVNSEVSDLNTNPEVGQRSHILENGPFEDLGHLSPHNNDEKPPEWVEWRETSDSSELPQSDTPAASVSNELDSGRSEQTVDETSDSSEVPQLDIPAASVHSELESGRSEQTVDETSDSSGLPQLDTPAAASVKSELESGRSEETVDDETSDSSGLPNTELETGRSETSVGADPEDCNNDEGSGSNIRHTDVPFKSENQNHSTDLSNETETSNSNADATITTNADSDPLAVQVAAKDAVESEAV